MGLSVVRPPLGEPEGAVRERRGSTQVLVPESRRDVEQRLDAGALVNAGEPCRRPREHLGRRQSRFLEVECGQETAPGRPDDVDEGVRLGYRILCRDVRVRPRIVVGANGDPDLLRLGQVTRERRIGETDPLRRLEVRERDPGCLDRLPRDRPLVHGNVDALHVTPLFGVLKLADPDHPNCDQPESEPREALRATIERCIFDPSGGVEPHPLRREKSPRRSAAPRGDEQPAPAQPSDRRAAARDPELVEDVMHVVLHRRHLEMQPGRDLLVRQPLVEQKRDLELPRRQRLLRRRAPAARPPAGSPAAAGRRPPAARRRAPPARPSESSRPDRQATPRTSRSRTPRLRRRRSRRARPPTRRAPRSSPSRAGPASSRISSRVSAAAGSSSTTSGSTAATRARISVRSPEAPTISSPPSRARASANASR